MSEMSDTELIQQALNMWANHIETDTVTLSAVDAKEAGQPFNALSLEQMKLVIRLRDMSLAMGG